MDQGLVAGCSGGTFDNVCAVADILRGHSCGNGTFRMSVYHRLHARVPAAAEKRRPHRYRFCRRHYPGMLLRPLLRRGRHAGQRRIFHPAYHPQLPQPGRLQAGEGQMAGVALMDARSIAATAINGGRLTAATELDVDYKQYPYFFDKSVYEKRVYNGFGKAEPDHQLKMGPNIKDWPEMPAPV